MEREPVGDGNVEVSTMKFPKLTGKHHKALLWGGIAVGVVVLILLARRSGGANPTAGVFTGNDATGSGSGGPGSDASMQAKSQAFETMANLMGQANLADIQGKTTLGLASIQAAIEESRNATTIALGRIQADAEGRAADASTASARYQTDAQTSAQKAQSHAQEGAQTLGFISSILGLIPQIITSVKGRNPSTGYPGGTVIIGGGNKSFPGQSGRDTLSPFGVTNYRSFSGPRPKSYL